MARGLCEVESDRGLSWTLKESIFELVRTGCTTFVLCPGARNSALISHLEAAIGLTLYTWPEERSAAFFALGVSRRLENPVAVVTTSGTAAAELLPAAIEAFYTGVPLILITADRPKTYRGSGAPQAIEQKNLFGCYAPAAYDLDEGESFSLQEWRQDAPCHLNICLGEPKPLTLPEFELPQQIRHEKSCSGGSFPRLKNPLAIVSGLPSSQRKLVKEFLLRFQAPVLLEGTSGLREDRDLAKFLYSPGTPYESVVRIGGIPTTRLWRDLEEAPLPVVNVSHLPFSGLSWGATPLDYECLRASVPNHGYQTLFNPQPYRGTDEASLMHALSRQIPSNALVYLGNSLPIRNWDLAATYEVPHADVFASRGANGIDGQLSTFFGLCERGRPNVGLVGDLTALYDLAAFWILKQLQVEDITVIIINNGGGQIFAKMFPQKSFLNEHELNFKPIAEFWGVEYTPFEEICFTGRRLIEVVPR